MIDLENDLRDALRPLRPDPAAFRRAVEEKLARRSAEPAAGGIETPAADVRGVWRSAAALLPVHLLQPEVAGAPALVLGKKLGVKGLAAAVAALPALSLAMLALTFVGTLRAIVRLRTGPSATRAAADAALREWWRAHALHALVTLVLLGWIASTRPVEAVVAVLLLSMLVVTAALSRLSRAGAASRASVGQFTAGFLGALVAFGAVFGQSSAGQRTLIVPEFWIPLVVLAGCVACDVAGRWRREWPAARKAAEVLVPTLIAALVAGFLTARLQPIGVSGLQRYVSGFDRPLADTVHWLHAGRVGEWLRARDAAPDLSVPRDVVAAAWRQGADDFEARLPDLSLLGAARLGVLPEELWSLLRTREPARQLLLSDAPLRHPLAVDLPIRALARGPLTESERDLLAARLIAGWPAPDAPLALEDMARVCALLDVLARPPAPDAQRSSVHAALRACWRGAGATRPWAAPFAREHGEPPGSTSSDVLRIEPTHAAVELMLRFGAPDGIALDRVRAWLQRMATPSTIEVLAPRSLPLLTVQDYRYRAAIALRSLLEAQELRGAPRPSLPEVLLAERILLAALLLVGLCLFATLRFAAPPAGAQDPIGA